MSNLANVSGKEVPILEWQGQRVITTTQLADVYETDVNNVQMNYANNKENFKEEEHYFYLTGEELRIFKNSLPNDIGEPMKFIPKLYLWTRQGASRHCKILDTPKAWQQFDRLEDSYYNDKPKISIEDLSPQTQLMNLLVENISKQELEQKRQAEKIAKLEVESQKQTGVLQNVKQTFVNAGTDENFQQWVNRCIGTIAESPDFQYIGNKYQGARSESYKRLTDKSNCRLGILVANAVKRAEDRGATKSQIKEINKLSVIMADIRLKELYATTIREMMIAYCVDECIIQQKGK